MNTLFRAVKASERLPNKYKWPENDIIHYLVDGVRADGNLIEVEGEVQFDYVTGEGNIRVYELHRVEWLEPLPFDKSLEERCKELFPQTGSLDYELYASVARGKAMTLASEATAGMRERVKELEKALGSIGRNASKMNEHTWEMCMQQILDHVDTAL